MNGRSTVHKSARKRGGSLFGDSMIWLCGGALALNLLLVVGLVALLAFYGFSYFQQRPLELLEFNDGGRALVEIHDREPIPAAGGARGASSGMRIKVRRGNADLGETDFEWIDESNIKNRSLPPDAMLLERYDWGNFYGFPEALRGGGEAAETEKSQLAERVGEYLRRDRSANAGIVIVMKTARGAAKEIPIAEIARAVEPNRLSLAGSWSLYISRVAGFLFDNPRNSNTEGGVFPAIFGTVMMVLLMSIAVVPLGVLAALYLREYAKQGMFVRAVRIAVNNLAGVPSIVFGMFGLGFFVYTVGGAIDRAFYAGALPSPTFGTGGILWASLTLALLTLPVVIVATEEGLAAVPRVVREGSLALGATKLETTLRVVIPGAAPGILTGLILAMARAAGEVAPLMIVGMVKMAPSLPIDGEFPFIHLERKFMHLGFHIYDVGFQNKNVDASKPVVFATAFLLIAIVTIMNLAAIFLRNHLRRKYAGAAV